MCFKDMEVITGTNEKFVYSPLPIAAGSYHENLISLEATGSVGYLRYLAVFDDNFKIWKHDFNITRDTDLAINQPDHSFLGLSFSIKNDLHCRVAGLGEGVLKEHQFSVTYLHGVNVAFQFKAGEECTIVGVDLTTEYLKTLLPDYEDILAEFVMHINNGRQASLHPKPLYISPEMLQVIVDFIKTLNEGKITRPYLQVKALELILMAFDQVKATRNVKHTSVTAEEQIIIDNVCSYLLKNLDQHITIDFVAQKFGISKQKLTGGFKEMSGKDLSDYILLERMEYAKLLLTKQHKSVKETAALTGYTSASNFSAIFKKIAGQSPSVFSKLARKKL